ncbi:hypothetical protein F5B22DRAFT_606456 [Xylaria bambusicola]|uniref:uncharacterized protein n=1 Tax=Xylaria bambusicola TaxID=326684 RepID=UPI0020086426|nr:uncharacterized protein F5B22DRAFT_606456 [Xylaria bambusicola]KAI0516770.1 hypothetical protein F5B22DRAFT_606456 [Xylaria bambusicola]
MTPQPLTAPTAFLYFPRLPTELRLNIWEETWPEPRILELTLSEFDDDNDDGDDDDSDSSAGWHLNYNEKISIRPTCRVSTWIEKFRVDNDIISCRDINDEKPIETYHHAVALSVCHEARIHTLRHAVKVPHPTLPRRSFFFHPAVDILWLSEDAVDQLEWPHSFESCGGLLASISRVLIEETNMDEQHLFDFFAAMPGLREVIVILNVEGSSDEEDAEGAMEGVEGAISDPDTPAVLSVAPCIQDLYENARLQHMSRMDNESPARQMWVMNLLDPRNLSSLRQSMSSNCFSRRG